MKNYELKSNELKIIKPKYDPVSGEFLGLNESLGYITVLRDEQEHFFDYGYNKENSKIFHSTHKKKIPDSFSSTIFNKHRILYEPEAFSETDFSNVFFFLPSTTDRIEDVNRYLGPVNLNPIYTEFSEFDLNFEPSRLDYAGPQKNILKSQF